MIHVIDARNVNDAYLNGVALLRERGTPRFSRAGDTLDAGAPVVTTYRRPYERVLFDQVRDANPFFHLFEAIWMMAGRQDVKWVSQFAQNMKNYSDDGEILNGAYGYRWRAQFDQFTALAEMLAERDTRRAVLTMWDARKDLASQSKDIPCNTHIYFRVNGDGLDMTVCCRSNDIIWGLYGSNAVHMSVLHEWMSFAIGYLPGKMHTLSNSFHAYTDVFRRIEKSYGGTDPYVREFVSHLYMVKDPWRWLDEARIFCDEGVTGEYLEPFFADTAVPMLRAWHLHKQKDKVGAFFAVKDIDATDWQRACREWLTRRWPLV